MSESANGENLPQRMKPPFPSRRELHGGRIPKLPAGQTPPAELATPPEATPEQDLEFSTQAPLTPGTGTGTRPDSRLDRPKQRVIPATAAPARRKGRKKGRKKPVAVQQRLEFAPKTAPTEIEQTTETHEMADGDAEKTIVDVENRGSETVGDSAHTETSTLEAERISPYPKRSETNAIPVVGLNGNGGAKKKSGLRRLRTVAILILIVALVGAGGYWAVSSLGGGALSRITGGPEDYPGPGTGSVEVTVEPGDLGTTIGNRLYDQGVVKSVEAFTQAFEGNKASSSIKPGTYTLRKEMSASEALAALLDEKNRVDNVITVNPGQTVAEIQEKMVSVAGFSADEVATVVKDPQGVGLPASAGGKLEGWLWPGSYEVSPGDTPTTVLTEMVTPTVEFMKESGRPEAEWEQVLTKASIIEREVIWEEHMPKVARVIENRLADPTAETQGMLQMDSTVNYGVGKTGGIPTDVDFANDNPYNTYLHAGLPPTPIASPSVAALEAALNPPAGNWLYFVTVNLDTGETLFTHSFEEMKKNTELLTKWCAENPGKC